MHRRQPPAIHTLLEPHIALAVTLLLDINDETSVEEEEVWLRDCMERWPSLQLGGFSDDRKLLGVVTGALDELERDLGWSHDLVVAPSARHTGLGHALIEAQLQAFRALCCRRVRGQSPARLVDALPFFERHGFRVVEETIARRQPGIAEGAPLHITERLL